MRKGGVFIQVTACPMFDPELSALTAAWRVCVIAVSLLIGALTLAPYWDTAVYIRALHEALTSTPM
jgi:hypothetical protein